MNTEEKQNDERYGVVDRALATLRGSGQVMFQNNALTGLLFIVGIAWGAYASDNISVAYGALIGLVASTATGCMLRLPSDDGAAGLWGFNGILVGCAFPTFLAHTPLMWVALVVCSMLTVWVRTGMNNVMSPFKVNSLTFPFVLTSWLFMLAARMFADMPAGSLSAPELDVQHAVSVVSVGPQLVISAILKGVSQVFLIDSSLTGFIFLVALLVSSRRAAVWALVGSALSVAVALLYGAPEDDIAGGLYSFSAVLTAIALGATFYKPNIRSALWTLLGIVVTVFVQAGMNSLMLPYGLPTFTAPFCVVTWIFLIPLYKLDNREPDHSHWHKNNLKPEDKR